MLRTVPVEGLDVDENDPLNDVGFAGGTEGFDEGWGFLVVLVDLDSAEDLEPGLVGIVHEEEGHVWIVFQVSQADVLLVAAQVCEAEETGVDDTNEAFGAAAMLYVGPTGFADGGHVEAVAALDEILLRWAETVSLRRTLLHALVLAPAAVLLLMFFDQTSEG